MVWEKNLKLSLLQELVTSSRPISGALGGAMGEILAPVTGSPELTKLATASLEFATGSDAHSIETAGAVAASGVENNYLAHLARAAVAARAFFTAEEAVVATAGAMAVGAAAQSAVNNMEVQEGGASILSTPVVNSGPSVLVTPEVKQGSSVISTPIHRSGSSVFINPGHEVASWQRLPGFAPDLGPDMSVLYNKSPLLPNEGKVGSYGELKRDVSVKGDGLDMHHGPNDKYMRTKGLSKNDGIAMLVRESLHREIHKKLKVQDHTLTSREALAESILRTREVYKEHDLYLPPIREGLQEKINQSKVRYPHLFDKNID